MSVAMTPRGLDGPNDNCPRAATLRDCSHALYMDINVPYTLSTALLNEWTPPRTKPPSTVKYIYHLSSPSHNASTGPTCPVNSVSGFFIRCIRKNLQDTGDIREGEHVLSWLLLPSPAIPSHVVCHVVFLHGVLVKAVRDVLQFLLLQTTNEAACLHANQSRAREGEGREGREEGGGKRNTVKEWHAHTFSCQKWHSASHTCMSSFKASSLFLSLPNESVIKPVSGRVGG